MPKFTFDFRFVNIERELWGLGEFLKTVEPQVHYLRDQDQAQTHARLREQRLDWDDPDTQIALQELDMRAKTVFPRLLRNPFIVTLWAAFESAIVEIADNLASRRKLRLRLRDVRGQNFLDGASKYYSAVAGMPLDTEDIRLERLGDLLGVRNVVAHANGLQLSVPREKWRTVERVLIKQPSISVVDGYLVLSEAYLASAYGDVNAATLDLINRVRGPAVREVR